MSKDKVRPTTEELYELLKRTSLPTVLVEGKDDIIFYRKIEEDLSDYGVDMLPAGNKGAVLDLYRKISDSPIQCPVIFVVDKDLWVHGHYGDEVKPDDIITTDGYSIENDLYQDGDLEKLLSREELITFQKNLDRFLYWYALAVQRNIKGSEKTFRTHPSKLLDDQDYYNSEILLAEDEIYPNEFLANLRENYKKSLRGKSLFSLIIRELSRSNRSVKFSGKQLMEFGASRKGKNFEALKAQVKSQLDQ